MYYFRIRKLTYVKLDGTVITTFKRIRNIPTTRCSRYIISLKRLLSMTWKHDNEPVSTIYDNVSDSLSVFISYQWFEVQ